MQAPQAKKSCVSCGYFGRPEISAPVPNLSIIFWVLLIFSFVAPVLFLVTIPLLFWMFFTKQVVCHQCGKELITNEQVRSTYSKEYLEKEAEASVAISRIDSVIEVDDQQNALEANEPERDDVAVNLLTNAMNCISVGDISKATNHLNMIVSEHPDSQERVKAELELEKIKNNITDDNKVEAVEVGIVDFLLGESVRIIAFGVSIWIGFIFIGVNFADASIENAIASWPITLPIALVTGIVIKYLG